MLAQLQSGQHDASRTQIFVHVYDNFSLTPLAKASKSFSYADVQVHLSLAVCLCKPAEPQIILINSIREVDWPRSCLREECPGRLVGSTASAALDMELAPCAPLLLPDAVADGNTIGYVILQLTVIRLPVYVPR